MTDFSFKTSKGEIFHSMMCHPETAKLIKEAMSSSVGSTSRAKAKKMFSIMNKLKNYNDGSGGPGMMYGQEEYNQMPAPNMEPTSVPMDRMKGMVIFHKIPKPKINYSYPKKDGGGGPGLRDGKGGFFDWWGGGSNSIQYVSGTPPKIPEPTLSFSGLNLNPTTSTWQGGSIVGNIPVTSPVPSSGGLKWGMGIDPKTGLPESTPTLNRPISKLSTDVPLKPTGGVQPLGWSGEPVSTTQVISPSENSYADNWAKYGGGAIQKPSVSTGTIGYGGEIAPVIKNKKISELTYEESQALYEAQKAREGSTLPNNPFGIKAGPATNHWIDEGEAVLGSKATDGGQFLVFKDENAVNAAYLELLYGTNYANLTVDEAMKKWSGAGIDTGEIPSKYAGLASTMKTSISQNLGGGIAALEQMGRKDDIITGGVLTAEQKIAQQDIEARKKWNIDTLEAEKKRKEQEKLNLPQDVTEYITARDQYLKQTDKAIEDIQKKYRETKDMSDPANIHDMNSELNYLYTLRGRQNQSYMGYLNQTIDQHQRSLDTITNNYNTALASYEREIKATAAITAGQYQLYAAALSDMYKEVQDAPTRALQLQYLQAQVLSAGKLTPDDIAKTGFIAQGNKLEGYIWTTDHLAIPGTKLVNQINILGELDPSISPANIVEAYAQGVSRYLTTPNDTTPDNATGTGITNAKKQQMAEEAIRNFADIANQAAQQGDDNALLLGVYKANEIGKEFATIIGDSISSETAVQLMEAVKSLAPKGIFGGAKKPPTEAEFVERVKELTGSDNNEMIAKVIYNIFVNYVADDGNKTTSPEGAVNAFLYNTSSTGTKTTPFTPEEFAQIVGNFYKLFILRSEFAQNQKATAELNNLLFPTQ